MIEAMACGTPVIAFNRGSVPEVIENGVTGFIVETKTGVAAVNRVCRLSRSAIRKRFEQRFTARRMANDYLAVYRGLMEGRAAPRLVHSPAARHRGDRRVREPASWIYSCGRVSGISSQTSARPRRRRLRDRRRAQLPKGSIM